MSETLIASQSAPVRFENVTKSFGPDVVAVDILDLHVEAGRLVTLLGPWGCGNTTALRMIAGLEMAISRRILIGDRDVTTLPATDRDLSMVFRSHAMFAHVSVLENVCYGLTFSGVSKPETRVRASAGLELVGPNGFDTRLPRELSGGQQQGVTVARALVLERQVLLFDEPLCSRDAKLRRQVREGIRAIQQYPGLTVVYVTHGQEEALAVSDEIVVLRDTSIAQIGTPRSLYDAPVDRFGADFIGKANILPCTIESLNADMATISVEAYTHVLSAQGLAAGAAHLAVRPSRLVIGAQDGFAATVAKAPMSACGWTTHWRPVSVPCSLSTKTSTHH